MNFRYPLISSTVLGLGFTFYKHFDQVMEFKQIHMAMHASKSRYRISPGYNISHSPLLDAKSSHMCM